MPKQQLAFACAPPSSHIQHPPVLPPTHRAGMTWSGFRPSDEPTTYGYNIPANMYAWSALERALDLNAAVWRSESFDKRARHLAQTVRQGASSLGAERGSR